MSRRNLPRTLLAITTIALPLILILFVYSNMGRIDLPPTIDPATEHYPEAVERLEAASQTLVTVTLAVLAATGIFLARATRVGTLTRLSAASVFVLGVSSMYFATKLGYSAALTLATGQGDIRALTEIFQLQSFCALLGGLVLGGTVAGTDMSSDPT